MDNRRLILILSDFNAANFAGYLANDDSRPAVDVHVSARWIGEWAC